MNRREKLLLIALIGTVIILVGFSIQMNVLVANEGKMPLLNYEGGNDYEYVLLTNETHFNAFADIIELPFVEDGYFSIGDLLIMFGTGLSIACLINYCIFCYQDFRRKYGK